MMDRYMDIICHMTRREKTAESCITLKVPSDSNILTFAKKLCSGEALQPINEICQAAALLLGYDSGTFANAHIRDAVEVPDDCEECRFSGLIEED